MSATGKLDRPGGSLYFELIDTTAPWALAVMEEMHAGIAGSELVVFPAARHGLPCSHGAACGRSLRAFLDRRAA